MFYRPAGCKFLDAHVLQTMRMTNPPPPSNINRFKLLFLPGGGGGQSDQIFMLILLEMIQICTCIVFKQVTASTCLYNICHSQARVEMTENIYGIWKRRFPLIKHIRLHVKNSVCVKTASVILHNMAMEWNESLPKLHMEIPLSLCHRYIRNKIISAQGYCHS